MQHLVAEIAAVAGVDGFAIRANRFIKKFPKFFTGLCDAKKAIF